MFLGKYYAFAEMGLSLSQ